MLKILSLLPRIGSTFLNLTFLLYKKKALPKAHFLQEAVPRCHTFSVLTEHIVPNSNLEVT